MASIAGMYDPNETGRQVLPAAEYKVICTKSELTDTKAGDGKILAMTWEVCEGEWQGFSVIQRLNLVNPNPIAQRIAHGDFNEMRKGLGLGEIQNTEEIEGQVGIAKVVVTPPRNGYGEGNDIKGWIDPAKTQAPVSNAAPQQTAPAPTNAAPRQAAGAKNPWDK